MLAKMSSASASLVGAVPIPRPPGVLEQAISHTHSEIDVLSNALSELEMRLHSVLRPDDTSIGSTGEMPGLGMSPAVSQVHAIHERIARLTARTNEIITRLEN